MKNNYLIFIIFILSFTKLYAYDNIKAELNLTQQEKEYIKNNPVVYVANDMTYPPMDFFKDGKPAGYSIELLELLLKKIGLIPSYDSSEDWESLVQKFKNKKIDILTSVDPTDEDKEYTLYSKRYLTAPNVLYVRKNDNSIKNAYDLKGKIVALPADYEDLDDLKKYGIHVKHLVTEDMYEAMEKVASAKADATIGSRVVLKYIADKEGYTSLKEIQNIYGEDKGVIHGFFFGVRKDKPILKSLLNKAMDKVTIQEKRALNEKWLETKESSTNIEFNIKEQEYLSKKGSIKICVDPDWLPYEKIDENGKYIGIVAHILTLAQERSNVELQLVPTKSWTQSIQKIKNRECDIIPFVMKTPQRLKYLNFTKPYLFLPLAIATRKNEIFIENLDSVKTLPLAIVKDFAYSEILKKRYPNIKLLEYENRLDALRKVENKEVFGFIDTIGAIVYTIQNEGLTDIKIAGRFDDKWKLAIGTRNDEAILNNIMEKVISTVKPSEIQQVNNSWNTIRFDRSIDYSLLIKILLFSFIVFILLFIWNQQLQKEKKRTEAAMQQLDLVLESSGIGIWKIDVLKGVSFNDKRMWKILGYERDDCEISIDEMGKLIHPDDFENSMEIMQKCVNGDFDKVKYEFRALRADRTYCWIHDAGKITKRDKQGKGTEMVGIAMDVTMLKNAQEEAERVNKANESLLRELYHRVKNNLQVISSFLSLQAEHYQNDILKSLLNESNLRIKAMSLIHEQLYLSKDPTQVNMEQYLKSLIIENLKLHNCCKVSWRLEADTLELSINNATLIGLIVNEILNNAFKHAFKSVESPSIEFKLYKDKATKSIRLSVRDNGDVKIKKSENPTLGMEIIEALTFQLEGTMHLNTDKGYHYEFSFPENV